MLTQIIDNIISLEKQEEIEKAVLANDFTWFFANTATYVNDPKMSETDKSLMNYKNSKDKFQFIHYLWKDGAITSQKIIIFDEVLKYIFEYKGMEYNVNNLINKLYRMKVNFTTPVLTSKMSFVAPHIDVKGLDTETYIYYINDSDGDTILFDEFYEEGKIYNSLTVKEKITPKRGRLIQFDGKQIHSATRPKKSDYRLVLNINIIK